MRRKILGRGILQNAERRMKVSGIECETRRYIIYDKLISYMPNPNPNLSPNPKPRVRVMARVRGRVKLRVRVRVRVRHA